MLLDYLIMVLIGLVMGIFGGMLGIGGSVIMIPGLLLFFKGNQHLYQAAAMVCNFLVAGSAVAAHWRGKLLVPEVLKWLVPTGIVAILLGVWLSNAEIFAGENSRNLTHLFGVWLGYVTFLSLLKIFRKVQGSSRGLEMSGVQISRSWSLVTGGMTGFLAGLLGLGGGTVSTPMQQLTMKMPLKRAMINSTALIASMALIGAIYKNATLWQHGISWTESAKIVVAVGPAAIVGGWAGGRLMHVMPKRIVRVVFTVLMAVASYKLLTA